MQKHIDFYYQCMETGYLPNKLDEEVTGLCGAASLGQISYRILKLFWPTQEDKQGLINDAMSPGWWGHGLPNYRCNSYGLEYGFTPLRQTIVLFMACLAGEKF